MKRDMKDRKSYSIITWQVVTGPWAKFKTRDIRSMNLPDKAELGLPRRGFSPHNVSRLD